MPKRITPRGEAAPPPTSPAPRKRTPRKQVEPTESIPTKAAIRNIRHIKCRVTLDTGRQIWLEPRGQRGDIAFVTADEFDDSRLNDNIGWLYEVISVESARDIISKQSTNENRQGPTLVELLRDEYGNPMTNKGTQIPFEQQGTVVARTEVTGPQTPHQSQGEAITRGQRPVGPTQVEVPGSVGHPLSTPNNYTGQDTQLEGGADALRGNVGMNPPQRGD